MMQHLPWVSVMPYRHAELHAAMDGLRRTGVALTAYDGGVLRAAAPTDDLGLFWIVPALAEVLGTDVDAAFTAFAVGVLVLAVVAGMIGCWFLLRRRVLRIGALVAVPLIGLLALATGDVYILYAALVLAVVPPFLALERRRETGAVYLVFMFVAGVALGGAGIIRSHAGTAVAVLVFGVLVLRIRSRTRFRLAAAALLVLGMLLPRLAFERVVDRRDTYLASVDPGYVEAAARHPFWHTVYIGLGFISNEHGIRYRDEVAAARVRATAPDAEYVSPEYEAVLREALLDLVRRDPGFIATAFAAKAGVILLHLLAFVNVGLLAAATRPKGIDLELPFWGALGVAALPGLIAVPGVPYLLGLDALAILYALLSVDALLARERGAARVGWMDVLSGLEWPGPGRVRRADAETGGGSRGDPA